ncbi:MAG: flagellar export chaperone FliS [Alphaproteobacteria bacterium]
MDHRAAQTYKSQQAMTASPSRVVAMLLDRAITSLREVIRAIDDGNVEMRWRANKRAIDILSYMWGALDQDKGGEIAANLGQLYKFMIVRLGQVDSGNNATPAKEVIALLEPLHRSWTLLADGHTAASDAEAEAALNGRSSTGTSTQARTPDRSDSLKMIEAMPRMAIRA